MISYEDLYKMVRMPNCTVAECYEEGDWNVDFKRALSAYEYNSWLNLYAELNLIEI